MVRLRVYPFPRPRRPDWPVWLLAVAAPAAVDITATDSCSVTESVAIEVTHIAPAIGVAESVAIALGQTDTGQTNEVGGIGIAPLDTLAVADAGRVAAILDASDAFTLAEATSIAQEGAQVVTATEAFNLAESVAIALARVEPASTLAEAPAIGVALTETFSEAATWTQAAAVIAADPFTLAEQASVAAVIVGALQGVALGSASLQAIVDGLATTPAMLEGQADVRPP